MKRLHLLSTVAASLLLVAGTAAAQDTHQNMPERAPAAQRHAPAEKIAPPMHTGEHSRLGAETTGQGGQDIKADQHTNAEIKSGDHEKVGAKGRSETTGQASKDSSSSKTEMNEESKSGAKEETKNSSKSESGAKTQESAQEKSGASKNVTTGQGAAAGSAKLSAQQRTKITTIIRQKKVKPTHLNISVHVGARVPASVHFYPLPVEVVDVYPEWRGYDYILVGDQIIVVDPHDHEIIAILET
jgi:Protein of unknown function (DUF1236)